ncbi:cyclase family protein [Ensifer sp. ENS05]|uniref:cyclase family protein n=1 Tax=Ensifer sp. ENS05 TaxID=2769277 RepID=UPI0017816358|nr:cyclase family protein [Ensifer sp. ENS05]MBD9596901.1 cyclase family protein [Ensifer sp. ENS05]
MCNHCVIEDVKRSMLSRRKLLSAGLAATGAAAVSQSLPQATQAAANKMMLTDLTHELSEKFPTFTGEQQFFIDPKFNFAKDAFNQNEWRINEHTGTHVDAPLHFSADGMSVGELPIEDLVAPLAVIDIRTKAADDADAQLTPDDIAAWTSKNGDLPPYCVVAMLSGWDTRVRTNSFRNIGDDGKTMHFPGFHVEAVHQLLDTSAKAIAVDTLSLDYGKSEDFAVHSTWLPAGRYGIECLANLASLPAAGATIIVGAPKVKGGSGGPARVLALQ